MAIQPFQWIGNHAVTATEAERNRKTAEALASRYPKPQNMWEGIAAATGDIGGALLNWQADQAEEKGRSEVAKALEAAQNGGNPMDYLTVLGNEWASPSQSAVANALLNRAWTAEDRQAEWAHEDEVARRDHELETADSTDPKFGLTPIWGQFPDGTFGYGVQANDGTFHPVDTGDLKPLDPRTLSSEKAAGAAFGKGQGNAVFDLPQAKWNADETIREVEELRNHPGKKEEFSNILGAPQQVLPAWPGTEKANFRVRRDQIIGRTFLAAYETLRGGGQITEVEGKKAQDAVARMSTATSEAEFDAALDDFERAVREGYAKLEQQSAMSPHPTAGGGSGSAAGNTTSTGVTWSVEP